MKHEMKLNNGPYVNIKNGTKTIELRLNDDKRQLLKIKDLIEFTNKETLEQMLVEIQNLYHYPSFDELYKHFDKVSMGYKENDVVNYSSLGTFRVKQTDSETVGIQTEFNLQDRSFIFDKECNLLFYSESFLKKFLISILLCILIIINYSFP